MKYINVGEFMIDLGFWKKKFYGDGIYLKVAYSFAGNTYYYIYNSDNHKLVGQCDIRFNYSDSLYYYGNIGYRIYEEYRGHGYAYKASLVMLEIAKEEGMPYVILTASPDNPASVKTIEKLHPEFIEQTEVPKWHELYRRGETVKNIYKIELNKSL